MTSHVEKLVQDFEDRRISRRQLVATLLALVAAPKEISGQQQVAQVARARTINHVSIGVSDVEASAAFYQRLLGLDVVSRPGNGGINLGLGDSFLGIYSIPGYVGRAHHICLGVDDYDPDAIAELANVGDDGLVRTNEKVWNLLRLGKSVPQFADGGLMVWNCRIIS